MSTNFWSLFLPFFLLTLSVLNFYSRKREREEMIFYWTERARATPFFLASQLRINSSLDSSRKIQARSVAAGRISFLSCHLSSALAFLSPRRFNGLDIFSRGAIGPPCLEIVAFNCSLEGLLARRGKGREDFGLCYSSRRHRILRRDAFEPSKVTIDS